MDIQVKNAQESDMPSVLNLINELAVFEKEPEAVEITLDDLIRDGFSSLKKFHCFVAKQNNDVIGMALVYNRYSTWKGESLHLEDLIVSQKHRGYGIGSLLLNRVIQYGSDLGVKRISWEVLNWNTPAINFYKSKGASIMHDWRVVQLDQNAIFNYIKQLK